MYVSQLDMSPYNELTTQLGIVEREREWKGGKKERKRERERGKGNGEGGGAMDGQKYV